MRELREPGEPALLWSLRPALEPPVHSLVHFCRVATEDLTHADSRLWRTLAALLFNPGYLTAQFLAGRRARYLPPVRLYLVLSVAFFLFAAATQPKLVVLRFDPDSKTVVTTGAGAKETQQQREERLCGSANYDGPWSQTLQPDLRPRLPQGRQRWWP